MFMDALTASTKSKEPRKRKRRISITKDGTSESKKQEIANAENRESASPPASPSNAEDKSPVALKPNFKVNAQQKRKRNVRFVSSREKRFKIRIV